MADYYPLIARAVAGLDKNTGDARRALYEKARAALVGQLRGVTPALDESDVTRERLALEEAIRKVEGESARQSMNRTETTSHRVKAPEFPRWQEPARAPEPEPEPEPEPLREPESELRPPARRAQQSPPRPEARQEARQETTRQETYQETRQETRQDVRQGAASARPFEPFAEAGHEPPEQHETVRQEQPRRPPAASRPDSRGANAPGVGHGKGEPRRGVVDSDEATAYQAEPQEPRNAPRARATAERGERSERTGNERGTGERGAGERGDRRSAIDSGFQDFREVVSEADELGAASARANRSAREKFAAVPKPEARRSPPRGQDADEGYLTLDDLTEPVMLEPSFIVDESRPVPPRARQAPPAELERHAAPRRSYADLIRIAVGIAVAGLIGSLMIWQWPNMVTMYAKLTAPPPPAEVVNDNQPATTQHKMSDRIEPGGKPSYPTADVAGVGQRVVLYEEDPNDPQGKRSVGSVVWRTDAVSPGTGKPPELAVRADIEIPERKMSMTWTLRRDTDPSRSTSHTIEIMFKMPPDFPSGGIFNVPGIWMKQAEQTQGTALAGLAVKVTTNYFLIGLSNAPADKERNVQLLKERPWFDIPIVYTNNRRAILAMEKGTPGERAFADAFAAWDKTQ